MSEFVRVEVSNRSITQRKNKVHGVGTNDAWYMTKYSGIKCPYYVKWKSMIERCYSEVGFLKDPTYVNCIVCDEWLLFSNFLAWMEQQDWVDKQLDKDIMVQGNKIYSPETCVFVNSDINLLLTDCRSSRGEYPLGVTFSKRDNKYIARIRLYSKSKILGSFKTSEEASAVYSKVKYYHILEVAEQQSDHRVKLGLVRHARAL